MPRSASLPPLIAGVLFVGVSLFSIASVAAQSTYTDLKLKSEGGQCKTIKTDTNPYFGTFLCPGFAGWQVTFEEDDHARSWLVLERDGRRFSLYEGIMAGTPGYFPALAGTPLEWRHDQAHSRPYAVIFRVRYATDVGTERTILLIARLTADAVCVIGGSVNNEGARAIADGSAGCR